MNTKASYFFAVLVALACAFLSACDQGISSSDYAKLGAENQRLARRNEDL
jgi:F0F1-type ATP synthase membrane subunit c/vacuolar-type H+-ATPase subunit K